MAITVGWSMKYSTYPNQTSFPGKILKDSGGRGRWNGEDGEIIPKWPNLWWWIVTIYPDIYINIYIYTENNQTAGVSFQCIYKIGNDSKGVWFPRGKLQIELSTGRKLHCLTFATAKS